MATDDDKPAGDGDWKIIPGGSTPHEAETSSYEVVQPHEAETGGTGDKKDEKKKDEGSELVRDVQAVAAAVGVTLTAAEIVSAAKDGLTGAIDGTKQSKPAKEAEKGAVKGVEKALETGDLQAAAITGIAGAAEGAIDGAVDDSKMPAPAKQAIKSAAAGLIGGLATGDLTKAAEDALSGAVKGGIEGAGDLAKTKLNDVLTKAGLPKGIASKIADLASKGIKNLAGKVSGMVKQEIEAGIKAISTRTGADTRFFFYTDDPKLNLQVLSFSGVEGLSQLYSFDVELVSTDKDLDFDKLINKSVLLKIKGPKLERLVHGIATRVDLVGMKKTRARYRLHLAPPHYRLTFRRRLRIFQDKTTQDIVTQVLKEGGISKGLVWKLKEKYKPRNYCVQYRESDLAFISRLLEEDGIAYHFEHAEKELRTVFTDDNSAFKGIAEPVEVSYNADQSMTPTEEYVNSFSFGQQLRVGKVHLRDFSFKQPGSPIDGVAEGKEKALEVYEYPGEFGDKELAERLAKVRLQEHELERQLGGGGSDCNRFIPGATFKLGGGYPRTDLKQEYLLIGVMHSGSQPAVMGEEGGGGKVEYHNTFHTIPVKVTYRPARATPVPVVHGTHTATVVGPKGEEIYVDNHGRVKVHFHWDREGKSDETGSCWIRVSQGWAGSGYGGMFFPRVGQEVLVGFLEGDPDRPYITGRVYNAVQSKGYDPPAKKTVSSIKTASSPGGKGFNELRFEDKAGSEELFIHAQKDMNVVVGNDRTTVVGHDRKEQVKNNQTISVTCKATHTADEILIQGNSKVTLKVGSSTIIMDPSSIKIFAVSINSAARALHEIKGALVKIN